jgi:hypothetical protein
MVGFGVWLSLHLLSTDSRPFRGCLITATPFCACSFSNQFLPQESLLVRISTSTAFFWYFWLTIQNKADAQVRNLFFSWLYLSRFPWRAARHHPTPPPFGGFKYQKSKKKKIVGVGVVTAAFCLLEGLVC